ncbi:carbon storage regulator CsrA [Anatilimnocola sp. NA78]|uniref:carbon storage regulator CsrA n=1 Tax=Anatilimnocola sp. NA78 TaxID=3415683 RepID=UPI003CE5ACD4
MLVLSRKVGERLLIGDNIAITVVRIQGGGVRIGVEAPSHLAVVREELKEKFEQQRLSEQSASPPAST